MHKDKEEVKTWTHMKSTDKVSWEAFPFIIEPRFWSQMYLSPNASLVFA